MRTLIVLLLCSISVMGFAQEPSTGLDAQSNTEAIGGAKGNANTARAFDNRYEGVRGTPYLRNQWTPGLVKYKDGKVSKGVFKVDVYGNSLMALLPSGDSMVVVDKGVEEVNLELAEEQTEVLKKYLLEPARHADGTYAVLLYSGPTRFLIHKKKNLMQASYQGGYSAGRPYDEFIDASSYYIHPEGAQPVKINRLNKKNVLGALPKHAQQVKSYLAEQKLDLQQEADVVRLLQYYDSMP
jgi:hypothetical protein